MKQTIDNKEFENDADIVDFVIESYIAKVTVFGNSGIMWWLDYITKSSCEHPNFTFEQKQELMVNSLIKYYELDAISFDSLRYNGVEYTNLCCTDNTKNVETPQEMRDALSVMHAGLFEMVNWASRIVTL